MARITWRDADGDHEFSNDVPWPGDRFAGWTPDYADVEDRQVSLGTGAEVAFLFRRDYVAHFEIREIPVTRHRDFFDLRRWLKNGGLVTLFTDDRAGRVYACRIRPGTTPTLTQTDAGLMLYTAAFDLKRTTAGDMLCDY